jgi:hypothetical protein
MPQINEYILEKCKKEYPAVETVLSEIKYSIEEYGHIEKIKFTFGNDCCPIYCLCDGRYMMWYGDHGSFTFDCTWQTSLMKIPFNSPHYLFEKLDKSGARGTGLVWNPTVAKKALLERIYETSWWEEEIESDAVREQIKELFEGPAYKDSGMCLFIFVSVKKMEVFIELLDLTFLTTKLITNMGRLNIFFLKV